MISLAACLSKEHFGFIPLKHFLGTVELSHIHVLQYWKKFPRLYVNNEDSAN